MNKTLGSVTAASQSAKRSPPSSEPLVNEVELHDGIDRLAPSPNQHRTYFRAKSQGTVTWRCADEFAIELLGMHPLMIWGEEWLL